MCALCKAALAAGVAATLGALVWIYATALAAPAVGTFHDDGLYAVTAQALATGHGYRITSLPGAPAQTKYPFLFPALLAAVWRMFPRFPENVLWLKLVPFACALAWGWLAFRWLRRETRSARVAWSLTGLMAVSPWVLFLATALLSETLFAVLLTAALVLLARVERGAVGWKTVMVTASVASGAFLTRTAGAAVIGAGALVCLLHGGWRRAVVFLGLSAAGCAPWIVWQVGCSSFEPYYSAVNYADWTVLLHFAWNEKIRIVSQNLVAVLLSPAVLVGVAPTGWGALLGMAVGALVAVGFLGRLRSGLRSPEILTVIYGALIVCWAWPPMRFMAPLLPLLLYYGYQGAMACCRRLPAGMRPSILAALMLALLLPAGRTLGVMTAVARDTGAVVVPNTPYDDWREVMRLASWLKQNTPADAVLVGNYDPVFYLYTGRRGVRGFVPEPYRLHYDPRPGDWPVGTPAEMWQAIDRAHAAYLVSTPNLAFREAGPLARLTGVLAGSGRFRLVYQSRDARYRIYRIAGSVDSPCGLRDLSNLPHSPKLLASN